MPNYRTCVTKLELKFQVIESVISTGGPTSITRKIVANKSRLFKENSKQIPSRSRETNFLVSRHKSINIICSSSIISVRGGSSRQCPRLIGTISIRVPIDILNSSVDIGLIVASDLHREVRFILRHVNTEHFFIDRTFSKQVVNKACRLLQAKSSLDLCITIRVLLGGINNLRRCTSLSAVGKTNSILIGLFLKGDAIYTYCSQPTISN